MLFSKKLLFSKTLLSLASLAEHWSGHWFVHGFDMKAPGKDDTKARVHEGTVHEGIVLMFNGFWGRVLLPEVYHYNIFLLMMEKRS